MPDFRLKSKGAPSSIKSDAVFFLEQTDAQGDDKVYAATRDQMAELSGGGATAVMSGVQPNVPAVNANATYTVSSNAPFAIGQYIALAGVTGIFQVASVSGSNLLELKNISATAGTAIASGVKVVPSGSPGPAGPASTVPGPAGQNAYTALTAGFTIPAAAATVAIAVANSAPFNVNDKIAIAGNYFVVTAIGSATAMTIRNDLATQTGTVANGAKVQISGEPGAAGAAGQSAYTNLTAVFATPAVTTTGSATVASSAPFSVGDNIAIAGRYFVCTGKPNATTLTLRNDIASQSGNCPNGSRVQIAPQSGSTLTVRTADSTVTGIPSELVLPNGTLAIASAVATYTPAPSGGGGSLTWATISGDVTASVDAGYLNDSAVARNITLPASPSLGKEVAWANTGTGGIKVFANNGQNIRGLSQTINGTAKYLQNNNQFAYGAAIALSNTEWILKGLPINMIFGEDVASATKSLIHFNEAVGVTLLADEVVPSRVITLSAGAAISASGKFSNGINISTANDYIEYSISNALGTSDFCFEFFINPNNNNLSDNAYFSFYRGTSAQASSGSMANTADGNGNVVKVWGDEISVQGGLSLGGQYANIFQGTWKHYAFVRQGDVFTLYVDGVVRTTINAASEASFINIGKSLGTTPFKIRVGAQPFSSGASNLVGRAGLYDEMRLSVGSSVYTAPFTPPTSPFTFP